MAERHSTTQPSGGHRAPRITPSGLIGWGSDHRPHGPKRAKDGESAMTQKDAADKPLNSKQEAFCNEYLIDMNASQAAIRAGYSARTAGSQAHDLLKKPEIAARIAQLQQERGQRTKITQNYVLENLQEVLERCMQRAPVMVKQGREYVQKKDDEGRDVWEFDAKGSLGALKLMGDHLSMWKEKETGKDRPVNVNFNFQPLTPEQIAAEKARRAQDD